MLKPPGSAPPQITDLELTPHTFTPARRGSAIVRSGRAGAALRFRLSRPAQVRFEVVRGGGEPEDLPPKLDGREFAPRPDGREFAPRPDGRRLATRLVGGRLSPRGRAPASGGRFSIRGRRGLNRLRFSGRVRGRPLAAGAYTLRVVAVDRAGRESEPDAVRFRIGRPED
jgi:hypothetical protein